MKPLTIKSTQLRTKTRDVMERVKFRGERFIVQTFGRPMAVIISMDDFQRVCEALRAGEDWSALDEPSAFSDASPPVHRKKRTAK